jgi:hypothetical protein
VHPEIEFIIADGPEAGVVWVGPAEVAKGWREYLEMWEGYRFVANEFREIDAERVLVLGHATGRGKTSGLELEQMRQEGAALVHVTDGKVKSMVRYWDRNRALADLGLTPDADPPGP